MTPKDFVDIRRAEMGVVIDHILQGLCNGELEFGYGFVNIYTCVVKDIADYFLSLGWVVATKERATNKELSVITFSLPRS